MDVIDVLEGAKIELMVRGHNKTGTYMNKADGSVCALGACMAAAGMLNEETGSFNAVRVQRSEAYNAATNSLYEIVAAKNPVMEGVTDWNDYHASLNDVMDLYDEAILRERQKMADA